MAVSSPAASARSAPASAHCSHCNLPVPASRLSAEAAEQFCCAGCEAVWKILHECDLAEYYRLRAAYEEKAPAPARISGKSFEYLDDPEYLRRFAEPRAGGFLVRLYLEGVHCIACAWLVEKILLEREGASFARLDLGRSIVEIVFNPAEVKLSALARALDRIGYTPHAISDDAGSAGQRKETRRLLARLGVAAASSMNIMLLAVSQYAGDFTGIEAGYSTLFRWVSFGLALPAVLYSAWPYYRGAWHGLRRRMLHMDLPISLGIIATFVFSTVATIQNHGEVYYDSVTGLIALLLGGRLLLQRAGRWAADAGESLLALAPRIVKRVEGSDVREVLLTEVMVGDRLRVLSGETVPVDGVLDSEHATITEAHLTGEAAARTRRRGDALYAGSTVVESTVDLTATAVGETTRLARLAELMRHASARRAPIIGLMDRIAGWFVGAVLVLALATLGIWLAVDPSGALWNVAALMVVACPCALGLATPVALAVAMGRCARKGIFVKGQDGIERLASVDHVILDKTGTLTTGKFLLTLQPRRGPGRPLYDEVMLHVAALQRHSRHPLASGFLPYETEGIEVRDFRSVPGSGLDGIVEGYHYRVGTEAFVAEVAEEFPANMKGAAKRAAEAGFSPVWIARDGCVELLVHLRDELRSDAAQAVLAMRHAGMRIELLSGDHPLAVLFAGVGVDCHSWRGHATPEDKLARVEELLAKGKHVAMAGDGVNDAAALSRATVGISAAGAVEVARDAADVFIAADRGVMAIAEALQIARRAMRVIRVNLAVALIYNVIGVSLAMTGLINPLIAAIFMPVSSLTVLLIASRA